MNFALKKHFMNILISEIDIIVWNVLADLTDRVSNHSQD